MPQHPSQSSTEPNDRPAEPVRCEECGRTYDASLFRYGRTIDCACGRRVGATASPRDCGAGADMRFIVDAMLGRLARWLRILGFDAAYEPDIDDADLARRAVDEGRIVLTRDRLFPDQWRIGDVHLISTERPMMQLRETAETFGLARHVRLFTRCSRCNAPLVEAKTDDAAGRGTPRILERKPRLTRCPRCDRFYWHGTHAERMQRMLDRALGDA